MIQLYCVRRSSDPAPPGGMLGIDRQPVRVHRVGSLSLWYSERERAEGEADDAQVHDTVVRAALGTATPLPCRHDSVLGDLDEAERIVSARRDMLAELLTRVEGCVEIAIRVRPPEVSEVDGEPLPVAGGRGREYLDAARVRHRRRAEGLAAAGALVRGALRDIPVVDIVAAASRGGGVDVAVLVRRDVAGAVRERIAGLVRAGGAIVGSTGPWPPYTFAVFPASQ